MGTQTPVQPVPNPTGISVLEQHSWSRILPGQVPLPSLARIWRKTETPISKKALELRCDRRFLRHPFPTPQELSPSGMGAERGSQGIPGVLVPHPEFLAPYTAQDSHPTHLSHKPLPPVPWNCKQGIMRNFFACASCRREWC